MSGKRTTLRTPKKATTKRTHSKRNTYNKRVNDMLALAVRKGDVEMARRMEIWLSRLRRGVVHHKGYRTHHGVRVKKRKS